MARPTVLVAVPIGVTVAGVQDGHVGGLAVRRDRDDTPMAADRDGCQRRILHRLMARADADRIEVDYVVLRPALSVAMQRACGRSGQALTDPGPVARMHSEFSALGPYERHVIDSASMSPQDTAEAVRSSVATGTMRLRHG